MVTLVQPLDGGPHALWRLVWSNVPEGEPLPVERAVEALPWATADPNVRQRRDRDTGQVSPRRGVLRDAETSASGLLR